MTAHQTTPQQRTQTNQPLSYSRKAESKRCQNVRVVGERVERAQQRQGQSNCICFPVNKATEKSRMMHINLPNVKMRASQGRNSIPPLNQIMVIFLIHSGPVPINGLLPLFPLQPKPVVRSSQCIVLSFDIRDHI